MCAAIEADYAAALKAAKMCTVGASNQCAVQVASGFFCDCMTFANGAQDTLTAIAAQLCPSARWQSTADQSWHGRCRQLTGAATDSATGAVG